MSSSVPPSGSDGGGSPPPVVIAVCGAPGCGKSSLVYAAAHSRFLQDDLNQQGPHSPLAIGLKGGVLPPLTIPPSQLSEHFPVTLIDTSSAPHAGPSVLRVCMSAHVLVLCYAVHRPDTLAYLHTFLLPTLRQNALSIPVILVGTMQDLQHPDHQTSESEMVSLMSEYKEMELWVECSARWQVQVTEVMGYAVKAVVHPTQPLFDMSEQVLRPRCVSALTRIFRLCDLDQDALLSDHELNLFQMACFKTPLQPQEIEGVKKVVSEKLPSAVTSGGLTLGGFLFLHALFIERGRIETTWTVLRTFGYSNSLLLSCPAALEAPAFIPGSPLPPGALTQPLAPTLPLSSTSSSSSANPSSKTSSDPSLSQLQTFRPPWANPFPDQVTELSLEAVTFLRNLFFQHDKDQDGILNSVELAEVFAGAPHLPWEGAAGPCVEGQQAARLTLSAWMSFWTLTAMTQPQSALCFLLYMGYTGDICAGLSLSRRRVAERRRGKTERLSFKVLVLGAPQCGKSSILQCVLQHDQPSAAGAAAQDTRTNEGPLHQMAAQTPGDNLAARGFQRQGGGDEVVVLYEPGPESLALYLLHAEVLQSCDAALLVIDQAAPPSHCDHSFHLLQQLREVESEVPVLVLAAKADLPANPETTALAQHHCQAYGLPGPLPISTKSGNTARLFDQLLEIVHNPMPHIPETPSRKAAKQARAKLTKIAVYVSVGTTVGVVGLVLWRFYTRKSVD